jgi:hypothetical protein
VRVVVLALFRLRGRHLDVITNNVSEKYIRPRSVATVSLIRAVVVRLCLVDIRDTRQAGLVRLDHLESSAAGILSQVIPLFDFTVPVEDKVVKAKSGESCRRLR